MTDTTGSTKAVDKQPIDWMCVVRYFLYGALLGGGAARALVSPDAQHVYFGAAIGAVLLGAAKVVLSTGR